MGAECIPLFLLCMPCYRCSRAFVAKLSRHLLMLMTILTQTFFTFVRGHLVSLMLLSVWHNSKLLIGWIIIIF